LLLARCAAPVVWCSARLGDGKWLILIVLLLVPGLIGVVTDSEADGCSSLYCFSVLFTLCLAVVLFVHVFLWAVPRPVSYVDKSPMSAMVAGIMVGGPPLFGIWTLTIVLPSVYARFTAEELVIPSPSSTTAEGQCLRANHAALWNYFTLIASLLGIGLLSIAGEFSRIFWRTLFYKPAPSAATSAAATASASTSGSFSSDQTANLDNGRWLTMESRRIKSLQQQQ
jgi:hypothetical protein